MSNYSSFPLSSPAPSGYEAEAARAYENYVKGIAKYDITLKYATYVISGGNMQVPEGAVFDMLDNEYQDLRPWFELTYGSGYYATHYTDGQALVDAFNANPQGYDMRPITLKHANAIVSASTKVNDARKEISGFARSVTVKSAKAILNGEQLSKDFITRLNSAGEFLEQSPTYDCPYFPLNFKSTWHASPLVGIMFLAFDMDDSWTARRNLYTEMKEYYVNTLKGDEATFDSTIKLGNPTAFDSIGKWHGAYHGLLRNLIGSNYKKDTRYSWGRNIARRALEHLSQGTMAVPHDFIYFNYQLNPGNLLVGDRLASMQLKALQPGNPNAFWYHYLTHRVVVQSEMGLDSDGRGSTKLYLYTADMKTGALTSTSGILIGNLRSIASQARSSISQYLPHVPIYSQVDNPSIGNKNIQSMYRTEIANSPQLKSWLATQNKAEYHYALVLESAWGVNEEHFVKSDDIVRAQQGYSSWRGMFNQYGRPSDPRLIRYLQKESFSPYLRKTRGVSQVSSGTNANLRNNAEHYRKYLGPFNGDATAQDKARALWAYSGRREHKEFFYSDYSVGSAINALDLPSDLEENIFRGEGSRYTSTLYALAIPNSTITAAKEFMKKRVPVLVANYITSASASGNTAMGRFLANNQTFSTMGQNVPIAGLADRRYISSWGEIFGKAIEHYSNSPETLLMSDFKKVLEATVGWAGSNYLYGQDDWEVPYLYGNYYDQYMGLLGACAVLSNGQAFMPTIEFPSFLSDGQKGIANSLLNTYVLRDKSTVISNFSVNDTADVHSVHAFLSSVGALNSMQESPVFDVPSFHLMFKPKGNVGANYVSDPRVQVSVSGQTFRVPGMAVDAFPFEGPGQDGYGQVFHRQIVQTCTLYNNFRISSSSSPDSPPAMKTTVRVPINTTGTEGGSYGLTSGRTLSLSQVDVSEGQALNISPSFKLTKGQLLGSSALVYSIVLGAGIIKALRRGRYL